MLRCAIIPRLVKGTFFGRSMIAPTKRIGKPSLTNRLPVRLTVAFCIVQKKMTGSLHGYTFTRVFCLTRKKIFFILQRNVDKRIIWNVFISCFPHKKRTKEGGWGEALTAKSFVTSC